MAKVFAPILAFTCDEIWQSMPHRACDDGRNVLLNQMPENFDAYTLDEATMARWDTVMKLRQDVNGVLEKARADKRIGKALEAHVTLQTEDEELKKACAGLNLAEICLRLHLGFPRGGRRGCRRCELPPAHCWCIRGQGHQVPPLLDALRKRQRRGPVPPLRRRHRQDGRGAVNKALPRPLKRGRDRAYLFSLRNLF